MAKSAYNPKDAKKAADAIAAAKKRQAKWTKELAGYEKEYQAAVKDGDDAAAKAANKDKSRAKRNISSNKKTIDQKKEILALIKTTQSEEKAYAKILLNQSENTKSIIKNLGGGLDMKARGAAMARVETDMTSKEYQITTELLTLEKELLGMNTEKSLMDFDAIEAKTKLLSLTEDISKMEVDIAAAKEAGDTDKVKELQAQQKGLKGIVVDTTKILGQRSKEADAAQTINAMQDKMLGMLGTSKSALKGMTKQMWAFTKAALANPWVLLAAVILGILMTMKKLVSQTFEVRDALKASVGQAASLNRELMAARIEGSLLGYDAVEIASQLQDEFGDTEKITRKNVTALGRMSKIMGTTTEDTIKFVGQFTRLTGQTFEAGMNMANFTAELAVANNVAPGKIMEDIAANTEVFAEFGKDGGKNIARAAVQARKLGVSLETSAKMADSLLDFESSIEKEMEASMLIGKQLNYNKARELALSGDLEGATKDIVKQLGGADEIQKMNVLQRRALADSIGVSVDELNRLASGKVELMAPKKSPQEKMNEILIKLTEVLERFALGVESILDGLGNFVQDNWKKVTGAFQEGGEFEEFGKAVQGYFDALMGIYDKVKAAMSEVLGGEGTFAEKIGPALIAGLKVAVIAVVKALPGLVSQMIFGLSDIAANVADLAGTVVIGLVSAIADEIGKAFGVENLGAKVKEKLTWFKDFVIHFFQNMIDGVIILFAKMNDWLPDFLKNEGMEAAGVKAKQRVEERNNTRTDTQDKSTSAVNSKSAFDYSKQYKSELWSGSEQTKGMQVGSTEKEQIAALQAEKMDLEAVQAKSLETMLFMMKDKDVSGQQQQMASFIEQQNSTNQKEMQEMLIILREISMHTGKSVTEIANLTD
jgi:hypothetical protein